MLLSSARMGRPKGVLEPCTEYLTERFTSGVTSPADLCQEIREHGCQGSDLPVRRYVAGLWTGTVEPARRKTNSWAFASSAPTVGFLSGVAVHPGARKHGFGRQICRFLVTEALRIYGVSALIVDDWNRPALRLYEGMGMQYRPLSAAAIRSPRVTFSDARDRRCVR